MYFCLQMIRSGLIGVFLIAAFIGFAQEPNTPHSKPTYEFVPNEGQWHPLALYKSSIPFGNLYLESTGMVYDMTHPEDYHRLHQWKHDHPTLLNVEQPRRHAVRMRFKGVKYAPKTKLYNVQSHYYNYYLGSNSDKWASGIHPGGKVHFSNVYNGVDFEITGTQDIKYQWVLHSPTIEKIAQIQIVIEGASSIYIENKQLKIKTPVGTLTDDEPFVYQEINGEVVQLNCKYILEDSTVSFELLADFDPDYPLIIDPKLIFSTYSGSVGDNFGFTATYDSKGSLYAGGIVDGDQGSYPVTSGAYDVSWNFGYNDGLGRGRAPAGLTNDISISKYDSAGTKLLWATYLGGGDDEFPHSLVADRNDDLLILGTTYSLNFPHSIGCFDSTQAGGTDIIVTKLSEDGTTLLASTFIGHKGDDGLNNIGSLNPNYADEFRGDIITDDDGNIFVASCTRSDSMPLMNASQVSFGGLLDGFAFELNSTCSELKWATYLGGDKVDALYSIKLIKNKIYVGGGSTSKNLQTTDSSFSKLNSGGADGIIAWYGKDDKQLNQLTFWGTPSYDQIYFIGIDAIGKIYATGQTEGTVEKLPASTYGKTGMGQFIVRLDSNLTNVDLSTTFGNQLNTPNLVPSAFLIDVCDHIYFSGWGSSKSNLFSGSTADMEVTGDAEQSVTDSNDFYIIVLDKNAEGLLYATYFGGDSTADHVDGGTSRFDKRGVIYQSVCSSCPSDDDLAIETSGIDDFPTSNGTVFEVNPSVRCSNASFKIDLQIKSAVIADFIANPTVGCGPLNVNFTNKSILGNSFEWDFGDGTTSDVINPTHLYNEAGLFVVTLTVIDSTTCNISSVYQRQILVLAQSNAEFNVSFNGCENELEIENTSSNGFEYKWDFGDGNTSENQNPKHDYENPGTYNITLIVNEGSLCESEATQSVEVVEKINPEITLYNVFTPNNDPHNDCFVFDGAYLECKDYLLKIYNRWGEKIFESTSPTECWNGRIQNTNTAVAEGTYFYVLKLGNSSQPISGVIDVIY
ncbi:MAG: hypothetical protein COA58_10290 [Bacteroidetes bacterium]|nr:MAG: hypothetical protein COA58_10290 [Bacteroidota bacterium]